MCRNRPPQHYTALNRCKQETSRESVLRELVSHFYLPSFICLLCKALWTRYSVSDEYKGRLHGIHYFLWEGSYWNWSVSPLTFFLSIHLTYRKQIKNRKWNKKGIAELLPSLYLDKLNNMESFNVKQGKKSTNANESPKVFQHEIFYSLHRCFFWSLVLAVKLENFIFWSSTRGLNLLCWTTSQIARNESNFSSSHTKFKSIFQVAFQLPLSGCTDWVDRTRMLHLLDYFLSDLLAILWSMAAHFQPEYIDKSITVNKHCKHSVHKHAQSQGWCASYRSNFN